MSDELKLGDTIDDYCSRCQLLDESLRREHRLRRRFARSAARLATANTTTGMGKAGKKKESVKSLFDQVAAGLLSPSRSDVAG